MMSSPVLPSTSRQWVLAGLLFAVVATTLAAAYYWFLAPDYVVLAANMRPERAAAVVDELKKEGTAYQLRDGGTTILVPAGKADGERLTLAGDSLPMKGTVGFELFNQSDMGLTDFAQKVNYQRALQGEIARTIMSMDGIAYARVHLALPERSLFRANNSEPRAAVTLTPEAGVEIDAGRIAGIQRLVAASVPDLALDQVAVLDERGELLTPEFSDVPAAGAAQADTEADYRERVERAILEAAPRAHIQAEVTLVPSAAAAAHPAPGEQADGSGSPRQNAIRIVLFERSPVTPADEMAIRDAIDRELALDPRLGDAVSFSPAPEIAPAMPTALQPPATVAGGAAPASPADRFMVEVMRGWTIALSILAVALAALIAHQLNRRRGSRRSALVTRIRQELLADGATHGS